MTCKNNKLLLILFIILSCSKVPIKKNINPNENEFQDFYKKDSSYISDLNIKSQKILNPKFNSLNDTTILKIEDSKSVKVLENYYEKKKLFYKKYPLDKLNNEEDYIPYACKYITGDARLINEVKNIINSGNRDSIRQLLKKFNTPSCFRDNKISDTLLSNFIVKSLNEPYYVDYVIPLVMHLDRPDNVKLLENHSSIVKLENEYKLIYHLVEGNSKIGVEKFKELIIKEKDSILYKSDLNGILNLVKSKYHGKRIDEKYKTEISSLAINNIFYSILLKTKKRDDTYSSRIKIYSTGRTGRLNGNSNLSDLIEKSDKEIIPFLVALKGQKPKFSTLNINFINFYLLKFGYNISEKEFKNVVNDKGLLRYMCKNNIVIDEIKSSEEFYKNIFKDYITSRDINDFRFNKSIIYNVLPYFKSTEHDFFKNQIIGLLEEKEEFLPIKTQRERANKLISLHNNMNENKLEILNYLKEISFLSKNESEMIRDSLSNISDNTETITSNLFNVVSHSGKIIRFLNGYKGSVEELELSSNIYLREFKTQTWSNLNKEINKVCIIFNNKAYALELSKYLPYECKLDKLVVMINFILKDNGINDKVIPYNKISCSIYGCFIGNENTVNRIISKYIDY
ncbi:MULTISPECIES: hypothetical protein [Winogradskyella]|uniref:hypothetical protein n=1 Tax=Winogradskyella TaxID=286104 RepID=UPI0015CA1787|nr:MULTISPECIES: hypothetical protein [Winogradskyella]QXP78860.1 hypothetical protein H0I32_16900 [Winogradskyella sp. HaHa_3_26]